MNVLKSLFPALVLCVMPTVSLRAFARPASTKAVSGNASYSETSTYAEVDAYIEQQLRRLNLPGASLAIVDGDKIVHLRGFGRARPGGEAPTGQTPFFIGSTTKSFTALAVMQLVEAGKIELDAPVQRYLPWFRVADPQASAQISVRQLLNQTSSLPLLPGWEQLADFDARPDATERQARALSSAPLSQEPGVAFEYSNLNYNLLGLIIEAASGEAYADYIQKHIFDPLEMQHSYTTKAAARQDGLAVGHQSWFGFPMAAPDLPVPSGSLPSGQLIASAQDMGHYLSAQLNGGRYAGGQILSAEGIAELHRPAVDASVAGVTQQYGMGWYIEEVGQTRVVYHTGMIPDFYTYMALLPEQKKGVILLVNANHFTMELTMTEVGKGVTARLAGEAPAPIQLGAIPWALRALLFIPLLQIAGVAATLWRLQRWREEPVRRPSRGRLWGQHILLPLVPNLIPVAGGMALLGSRLRGFLMLFMPDIAWLTLVSGGFALVWTIVRSKLLLQAVSQMENDER